MPRKAALLPVGPTIPSPSMEGGLFHDPDAFPGTEVYNLYDVGGKRIGRWYAVEGATDTELIEALLDFLSRRRPALTLFRADGSSSLKP